MANFKVIYRCDESSTDNVLQWEPGCPVKLSVLQVARDTETSTAYLQLKVQNISNEIASSIYGKAILYDKDDATEEIEFNDLDADIRPGEFKSLNALHLPKADIESVDVLVQQVILEKSKWESHTNRINIPKPLKLTLSDDALDERKRLINKNEITAIPCDKGINQHDNWWVCPCSQLNVERTTCCNCNNIKEQIELMENEDNLNESKQKWMESIYKEANSLSENEDVESLQSSIDLYNQLGDYIDAQDKLVKSKDKLEKRLEDITRKNKSKVKKVILCITVFILIGWLTKSIVIPDINYHKAAALLNSSQYEEAIEAFSELKDFRDSKMQVLEAKYQYVTTNYKVDDFTTRQYILDLLNNDYKDSEELAANLYSGEIEVTPFTIKNDYGNDLIFVRISTINCIPGEEVTVMYKHTNLYKHDSDQINNSDSLRNTITIANLCTEDSTYVDIHVASPDLYAAPYDPKHRAIFSGATFKVYIPGTGEVIYEKEFDQHSTAPLYLYEVERDQYSAIPLGYAFNPIG